MRQPRGQRNSGREIQYFEYGPLQFNINRALLLAADRRKYQAVQRQPSMSWIGPGIDVEPGAIERSDLRKPVLFATIILDGQVIEVLVDGNHRVSKALKHQATVPAIVLDLQDTLRIVSGPPALLGRMKQEGARLGLLTPQASVS